MGWGWLSVGNPETLEQGQNCSLGLTLGLSVWILRMLRRKLTQWLRLVFTQVNVSETWFQRPVQKEGAGRKRKCISLRKGDVMLWTGRAGVSDLRMC